MVHGKDVPAQVGVIGDPTTASLPFGTLLRRCRVDAGLSQEMLAERSRMSVDAISALERGARRAPRRDTVALLVDALGLADAERTAFEDCADRAPLRGIGDVDGQAAVVGGDQDVRRGQALQARDLEAKIAMREDADLLLQLVAVGDRGVHSFPLPRVPAGRRPTALPWPIPNWNPLVGSRERRLTPTCLSRSRLTSATLTFNVT